MKRFFVIAIAVLSIFIGWCGWRSQSPPATSALKEGDIVISSSWKFWGLSSMQKLWANRGLPGKILDVTPNNVSDELLLSVDFSLMDMPSGKGSEIKEWLSTSGKDVPNYAILDGVPNMLPEQQFHFVQTGPRIYITKNDAESIIYILKS